MTDYTQTCEALLLGAPKKWLVTGAAGFIGSAITAKLLELDQDVIAFDNLSTGYRRNIEEVAATRPLRRDQLTFIVGDIRDESTLKRAMTGCDFALSQAALGSVPRSIEDPWATHDNNVNGFLKTLMACRETGIKRLVYASSSAVYGDERELPKHESNIGAPLSPYALTKQINEEYSRLFASVYEVQSVGLRYFNVYGPRQDPRGAYAAVIPRWIDNIKQGRACTIFGDGKQTRDFTFVEDAVQANLLAATETADIGAEVFNIAVGDRTSLIELHDRIAEASGHPNAERVHTKPRAGDIAHSMADISQARDRLGYRPMFDFTSGLTQTVKWFLREPRPNKVIEATACQKQPVHR